MLLFGVISRIDLKNELDVRSFWGLECTYTGLGSKLYFIGSTTFKELSGSGLFFSNMMLPCLGSSKAFTRYISSNHSTSFTDKSLITYVSSLRKTSRLSGDTFMSKQPSATIMLIMIKTWPDGLYC